MRRYTVIRTFCALNRQEPFEATTAEADPHVLDPADPRLVADLAAQSVSFAQFAEAMVEQGNCRVDEEPGA